jgi:hypothetical protein
VHCDGTLAEPLSEHAMKRAIVWLCWGEEFISEAIESARSAATIGVDRFLITDSDGAAYAQDRGEFTSITATKFIVRNNLEKSRLIDLLPEGYDTFLYLDTDTRVIGDLALAFDKAERHGIAIAPAPNYNLGEFFGFGSIMAQHGVEPADQMIYNAGVIFFSLTAAVRKVLERWRDLCANVGVKLDFSRDQPFLTLALEQLGFTPYVLSPLYNYRGLGEYAVGHVRIWHSHYPPPADLNAFDHAWPARRFKDGARIRADLDPAAAMPAPLMPEGMLRLMLPEFSSRRMPGTMQSIIAKALAAQSQRGSRTANNILMEEIGTDTSEARNESYFAEAFHYLLGLLHAHASEPESMAPRLSLSQTMPGANDDQLFSDHVNESRVLRAHQLQGIARGMPAILMACMPRSASTTLTHSLALAIGVPVLHLSAGRFPNYFLVPSWLDVFLQGGAITQDHFGPSDFNIGVLGGRGPRDLFVLVRDPRSAARSQVHFLSRSHGDTNEPLEVRIERECVVNFIPWLQGWLECARNPEVPFRVRWITYQEVCRDLAAVLRTICSVLQSSSPAMSAYATCQTIPEVAIHLESGDDHAWKAEVGEATRDRLWDACTPEIKSLLGLQW